MGTEMLRCVNVSIPTVYIVRTNQSPLPFWFCAVQRCIQQHLHSVRRVVPGDSFGPLRSMSAMPRLSVAVVNADACMLSYFSSKSSMYFSIIYYIDLKSITDATTTGDFAAVLRVPAVAAKDHAVPAVPGARQEVLVVLLHKLVELSTVPLPMRRLFHREDDLT